MDCKTIRGLILDASVLTAGLIVRELKTHGCELDLLHAGTMHEFEMSVRTSAPDIIFCNNLPPVIDAFTALKLKRDICPATPFFCISESVDDETVTELLRQGASDCIVRANHTWIEILAIKALREIENSQEHRKYDQRMYESQKKYSILFDTMPVGVIYQDATGEIISANPASEKILGISLDQMKGKTSMDPRWKMITEEGLDVPGSEHPAMIALRTGQKVGPVTRGIYLPDKNDYIWLAITATPLFRSGETRPFQVYASFEDITLKRKNEIAVKHQWQLLETVINHLPAAVNVLSGDDFRIKLANPSYRAFAPGKEMIGLTWDELWPETGQDFKRICKQVLDTGESFTTIDQHNTIRRSPEGPLEDAYFSWSLNRIKLPGEEGWGLLSTAWETTQRKNAESELEKSNHRLKKVLEAENVGVMFWNTEKGLLMDANDAFLKMMGYDRDDIEKQEFTWQKFTPQEYHGISLEEMEKFRTIGRVGPYEKEYYCKDGSRKWMFFAGSSLGGNECVEFCIDISDRKRLEKELEEKQVLIHEMGKAAKVGGWDFDVETGKGTWTEETARIHDMDPSFETNVDLGVSFFKPNSKQKIDEAIHKIIETGEPYNLELELVSAKGVEKWVQTIGNPVFENRKVIKVRGSIQDITARKLTEIAIAESEARYRSLFENMNAGFVLFEAVTNEQGAAVDLKILAANSEFEKTTGLNLSNAIGQHLSKVLPGIEKDEADWIGKYSQVILTGQSAHFEQGSELLGFYYSISAFRSGPGQCAVTFLNITERKKAENQLKLLNSAIEASSVAVIITNAEGVISYANPFFSQMTGYGHNEIMGQKPSILKSGFLSATLYKELWSAISSGNTWEGELLNKKKNGDLFWVRILISPITNSKGELTNFVAIQEDISFKKQAAEIQNQLEVAQKSARFKQDFLAKMSHEIRTPLTGVLGMIEVLGQTPLAADQQEYIADIKTSGENLKEIINQVLEYSKIEAGKVSLRPQDFEFKTLFQETKQLYKDNLQAGVEFNIEIDPNIPSYIHADKFRLSQIVHNLVSNAIKFTHHGSVTLKAGLVPSSSGDKPQVMKIEVSDTGKGISESLQSSLFSPFVQSEEGEQNLYEGTGLGLSICKELVQLMKGEVGVVSKEEQGSTFWFTFAFEATPEVLVSEKKTSPLEESRSLHILVTEDTLVLQKVTKLLLMSMGHQVQLANHGQHALEMFVPGKFDLILMDVNMPIMDGVTATRLLKEQYANLPPIVGLSANAFEGDREKYITTGMDDYMIKPFNKEEFERVVARLLPLVKE